MLEDVEQKVSLSEPPPPLGKGVDAVSRYELLCPAPYDAGGVTKKMHCHSKSQSGMACSAT